MGWISTPKPDPAIGRAAESNSAIAARQQQLAELEYADNKALMEEFKPALQRNIDAATRESELNAERSQQQWDIYQSDFRPIEQQMAQEAMTYDSAGETARREGLAAGTVQAQLDAQRGESMRDMARSGVSIASGRGTQSMIDQGAFGALAKAGAINQERNNTKLLGLTLRQQAAGFGRNMPNTGIATSAAALQGAQTSTGLMGNQIAMNNAAVAPAQSFMNGAVSANNSAANIGLAQFQNQANMFGSKLGAIGSLAGMAGAAIIRSDVNAKQDIAPVDEDAALDAVERMPVSSWAYKDDMPEADGLRRIGPMAQDVQAAAGDAAAPGGTKLDLVTMNGITMAAVQGLARKVRALEGQQSGDVGLARLPDLMKAAPVDPNRPQRM